ncbi:MAG: transposase [Kiritimatiellae bacterium]|nr:transposase [Kiritimatiellia bacterium]
MRKKRLIEQDRCYHLISRLAHRAFFLDDDEKDRAVALMRRVEEFAGVVVLAYAFMSNHFHIFVYVPDAEEIGEEEIMRRIRVLYRDASLAQVAATWNRLKAEEQDLQNRGRPTKKCVSRFAAYKATERPARDMASCTAAGSGAFSRSATRSRCGRRSESRVESISLAIT